MRTRPPFASPGTVLPGGLRSSSAKDTPAYDEVGAIIEYESGDLNDRATLLLFSHLVKTGRAWQLQGHYGRTAQGLIDEGYLDRAGTIRRYPESA